MLVTLAALALPSPAVAQIATGTKPPPKEEPAPEAAAAEGLLPVPDYTTDWQTRPALTGDWGGIRQDWAEDGFTFSLDWHQVGQGVVSGGADQRFTYPANFDFRASLDLMRMGVMPGALLNVRAQSRFGDTVNQDTGVLLPANTYSLFPFTDPPEQDVPFAITEFTYLQFLSDEVGFFLGKITTLANANEFAGGEGRSQFMNFQLVFPSVIAQIGPYSTLSAGALWEPAPDALVTAAVMNTADSSTTSGFSDIGEGTTAGLQFDLGYRPGGLPGGLSVAGAYAFDGSFGNLGGITVDPGSGLAVSTKRETWGGVLSFWQYLHTETEPPAVLDPRDGRQDLQGVGTFLMLGLGDDDTSPTRWSIAGGLSGRGLIPNRDDDTCGLGYFYNDVQDSILAPIGVQLAGSTQGLEAYYNVAIAPSTALSLDFQWLQSAFEQLDDAVIVGARLNVSF